jgi:nucleoside 2-deoxyribosyltransferase
MQRPAASADPLPSDRASKSIYIANPLGFTVYGRDFLSSVVEPALVDVNLEPINPFNLPADIEAIFQRGDSVSTEELADANQRLGQLNIELIDQSSGVLAFLDGADVDSGTASEIGYAAAIGRPVVGIHLDLRSTGDNRAAVVNLQIEAFIRYSGGSIIRYEGGPVRATIDDAVGAIAAVV